MEASIGIRVRVVAIAAGMAIASVGSLAQHPKVSHAEFSVKSGGLRQAINAVQAPSWIGYELATTHRIRSGWDNNVLRLEGEHDSDGQTLVIDPGAPIPPGMVLLRVASGRVTKVRDHERDSQRLQDGAFVAIALGSAPEGTAALRSFTAATYPADLRDRAAFWLANERGTEGFMAVKELLQTEPDEELRKKLVFDLTLVKGDSNKAALDELLALAKSDASEDVRRKAQFWLAQMVAKQPDSRIVALLGQQAANDPNAAIRKSAVFAISQLPANEGVPKLVQLASTTKDPVTRREAIFWLGQSKDPQALAYLEKLVRE